MGCTNDASQERERVRDPIDAPVSHHRGQGLRLDDQLEGKSLGEESGGVRMLRHGASRPFDLLTVEADDFVREDDVFVQTEEGVLAARHLEEVRRDFDQVFQADRGAEGDAIAPLQLVVSVLDLKVEGLTHEPLRLPAQGEAALLTEFALPFVAVAVAVEAFAMVEMINEGGVDRAEEIVTGAGCFDAELRLLVVLERISDLLIGITGTEVVLHVDAVRFELVLVYITRGLVDRELGEEIGFLFVSAQLLPVHDESPQVFVVVGEGDALRLDDRNESHGVLQNAALVRFDEQASALDGDG